MDDNADMRALVTDFALKNGMRKLSDTSGTNIGVQIFDSACIDIKNVAEEIGFTQKPKEKILFL